MSNAFGLGRKGRGVSGHVIEGLQLGAEEHPYGTAYRTCSRGLSLCRDKTVREKRGPGILLPPKVAQEPGFPAPSPTTAMRWGLGHLCRWDHHERGALRPLQGENQVTSPANLRSRAGMSESLKESPCVTR